MNKLIYFISISLLVVSCTKTKVELPDFDVSIHSQAIHAGDTVTFSFRGTADIITFYSGEEGHRYEFKDRVLFEGDTWLNFTSQATNYVQPSLSLLLSTDFSGTYDVTNITNATWTNVTDRITLSTGAANVPSGPLGLNEFLEPGKPLFVAFHYNAEAAYGQSSWAIQSFDITTVNANNERYTTADLATAGWIARDFSNTNIKWSISVDQLSITGRLNPPHTAAEDWLISKALYIGTVSPDVGIPVKDISIAATGFDYVFEQPGTYDVVFVATNSFGTTQKTITRKLTVKVEP
jgi:hypothetical protein